MLRSYILVFNTAHHISFCHFQNALCTWHSTSALINSFVLIKHKVGPFCQYVAHQEEKKQAHLLSLPINFNHQLFGNPIEVWLNYVS